jgi:tRNA dimethylallyltransferase
MKKLVIITGQTATGKTDLALDMAAEMNGELINTDARQIYTHLDIVTGKDLPSNHDQLQILKIIANMSLGYYSLANTKIWLYDIITPDQIFSAHDFQTCALDTIRHIWSQNKTPILVGGSYFYLYYLLYKNEDTIIEPDWTLRNELEKLSVTQLQQELTHLDQDIYINMNESDRSNPRRLIRKIELINTDSVPELIKKDEMLLSKKLGEDIDLSFIGIKHISKETLTEKIQKRIKKRVESGAVEEMRAIVEMGYSDKDPGLNTLGYKQLYEYIKGTASLERVLEAWTTKEIQYSKRQLTFMKKDPHIVWRTCP